jgi:hypothetical protein
MSAGNRFVAITVAFAVSAATSGCATIVQGRTEGITVVSNPPGATVKTANVQITTPGELKLRRDRDHSLVVDKEGFPTREIKLESRPSWWLLGNAAFGGLIGLVVDLATGSGYRLKPTNADIDLGTGVVKEFKKDSGTAEASEKR